MNLGANRLDYQKLFEMTSFSIALTDANKVLIFTNKMFLENFEVSREEIRDQNINHFIELNDAQHEALTNSKPGQTAFCEELLCRHSNGEYSEMTVIARKVELPYGNGSGFHFEILNLQKSEKSKSEKNKQDWVKVGKVVSQISHDISNPLAILRIHCDSFNLITDKQEMVSSQDVTKRVAKMSNATTRITDTTKELKLFAKHLLSGNESEIDEIWEKSQKTDNIGLPVKGD